MIVKKKIFTSIFFIILNYDWRLARDKNIRAGHIVSTVNTQHFVTSQIDGLIGQHCSYTWNQTSKSNDIWFSEDKLSSNLYWQRTFLKRANISPVLAGTVEQITCLHEWYHSIPSPMSASKGLAFVEQRNPPSVSYYCLWEHFAWEDWESDFQFLSNVIFNITRTCDHGQDVDASRL